MSKIQTLVRIIAHYRNWHTFLLAYFRILKEHDVVFEFRDGTKWHVDTTKRGFGVMNDIWFENVYDHIYKLKDPKVIVDLGAHIGSFTILAAKLYPKATIYAFEASPENYALLLKNIKDNKITNVKAQNVAVGEYDGTATFYVSSKSSGQSSLIDSERSVHKPKEIRIPCKKLASLFKENGIKSCDLLKIDIEDMELPTLKQASKDGILESIQAILAEIYREHDFKETLEFLPKKGFEIKNTRETIITAVKGKK
jgi:FkbM family methyltransferase